MTPSSILQLVTYGYHRDRQAMYYVITYMYEKFPLPASQHHPSEE